MLDMLTNKSGEKPCNTIDTLIGIKTELKGNITAKGDGGSTLVLSEHAVVTGNVTVPHMIINGTIKGQVRSSERIELQPKADITGDVSYKAIQVALGAVVNGNLLREAEKGAVTKLKSVPSSAVMETE